MAIISGTVGNFWDGPRQAGRFNVMSWSFIAFSHLALFSYRPQGYLPMLWGMKLLIAARIESGDIASFTSARWDLGCSFANDAGSGRPPEFDDFEWLAASISGDQQMVDYGTDHYKEYYVDAEETVGTTGNTGFIKPWIEIQTLPPEHDLKFRVDVYASVPPYSDPGNLFRGNPSANFPLTKGDFYETTFVIPPVPGD